MITSQLSVLVVLIGQFPVIPFLMSQGLGPAKFTLSPSGQIKVSIPVNGYNRMAIHYNINQPLPGVAGSRYGHDLTTPNAGHFEWQSSTQGKEGDTIHYWLWGEQNGQGETKTDLTAVIQSNHPTTTTTTTTTSRPMTHAPTAKPNITNSPIVTSSPNQYVSQNTGTSSAVTPATGSGSMTGSGGTMTGSGGTMTGSGGTMTGSGGSMTGRGMIGGNFGSGGYNTVNRGHTTQCQSYPCLIFQDDFNTLDFSVWEHEITASGGGNWEFEYYTNNRSNSYVRDGTLYIKPTLTADHYGEEFLHTGTLDLWGGVHADQCTSNAFYGCMRIGQGGHIINPIQSARLRSTRGFTMKYGKVEVEAKMPKGDWIWPAIWMLPVWNSYGQWPASGEIDIVEARGNLNYHDDKGNSQGVDSIGSTLHFGPGYPYDPFEKAHGEKHLSGETFADKFHKFAVEWDESKIRFTVDGEEILKTVPPTGGFWELGEFDKKHPGMDNPWRGRSPMAPFDQEFYLIMNVAVGGTGFFPDTFRNTGHAKPWNDKSEFAARDFWQAKSQWYPTWNPDKNHGEDAAMKVNYVKVWKLKP